MVTMKIARSNFLVLPTREWNPFHLAGPAFIISGSTLMGSPQKFEEELRELCIKYGLISKGDDFDKYYE